MHSLYPLCKLVCLLMVAGFVISGKPEWSTNEFHQLINNISNIANITSCWACTHMPPTQAKGWPVKVIFTLGLMGWNKAEIHTVTKQKKYAITDASQFMLSHQQQNPESPLCIRNWHGAKDQATVSPGHPKNRINVGDYKNCTRVVVLKPGCLYLSDHEETILTCERLDPLVGWMALYGNAKNTAPINRIQEQERSQQELFLYGLPKGFYWVCGEWAGKVLPPGWNGTCTIGGLAPAGISYHSIEQNRGTWEKQFAWQKQFIEHRVRRDYNSKLGYDPDYTYLTGSEVFFAVGIPGIGVRWNIEQIRKLSAHLELVANSTAKGLAAVQTEINSLAGELAQHKLALDYLLSKEGGLCVWLNTTCCHFVNESGLVEENVERIHDVVRSIRSEYEKSGEFWSWLTSWFPNSQWIHSLLGSVMVVVVLLVLGCLCIPCILKFVSGKIEALIETKTASQVCAVFSLQTRDPMWKHQYPEQAM